LGFRELERGLQLRPDNLPGGVAGVRSRFVSLAPAAGRGLLVYGVHSLDPDADSRARALWDATALLARTGAWLERLERSRRRLGKLTTEAAMVETFRVGGAAVRELHLAPLLPSEILDPTPRHALVAATRAYDELGRRLWADFLARHGVPNWGSRHAWHAPLGDVRNDMGGEAA
jgi:phenylacetic acid degradation operon negative regulatory protein